MSTVFHAEKNTRDVYEDWLNELGCPDDDMAPHGRVPSSYTNSYGTWLRQNDPIAFNLGFHKRVLEERR